MPGIHIDDATAARSIVNHLADQGHRRIAHIGGDPTLEHSMVRRQVFAQEAESRGVVVIEAAASDYSEQSGIQETSALLSRPDRPTAIVYDNEVLTLGGIIDGQDVEDITEQPPELVVRGSTGQL